MVGINEDPFAIDLLVNSTDKLLIDLAKHAGKSLTGDFRKYIKPEAQKPFYKVLRETSNFFKHADEDHMQSCT